MGVVGQDTGSGQLVSSQQEGERVGKSKQKEQGQRKAQLPVAQLFLYPSSSQGLLAGRRPLTHLNVQLQAIGGDLLPLDWRPSLEDTVSLVVSY